MASLKRGNLNDGYAVSGIAITANTTDRKKHRNKKRATETMLPCRTAKPQASCNGQVTGLVFERPSTAFQQKAPGSPGPVAFLAVCSCQVDPGPSTATHNSYQPPRAQTGVFSVPANLFHLRCFVKEGMLAFKSGRTSKPVWRMRRRAVGKSGRKVGLRRLGVLTQGLEIEARLIFLAGATHPARPFVQRVKHREVVY